ncbi:hypothetical protein Goe10_c01980 [Bacillus phage vB_BsuM-Goe10]|nr:hypothetical protein Goe10_c01980 [Bacillus phage vB_BsuM-Goe10]
MVNDPYTNPLGGLFDVGEGLKARFDGVSFNCTTVRKTIDRGGNYILVDDLVGKGYVWVEDYRGLATCEAFGKATSIKTTTSLEFDLRKLSEETKQLMVEVYARIQDELKADIKATIETR